MVPWIWKVVASEQAGFWEHHCTVDRTTYLAQEIEDGFQHKKQTLTVWIDLQKTFHTVWTDGLLLKLKKCNIARNMFRWIKSHLHNRRARLFIDNTKSKKILLRHEVPQGGVISPTIFINDFHQRPYQEITIPSEVCNVFRRLSLMEHRRICNNCQKTTPRSNQHLVKLGTRQVCKDK